MHIQNKHELPLLIKRLGLTGEGVEIGVRTGDFSPIILKKSSLSRLYSIDPWIEFSKEEYDDISNFSQEKQDENYLATIRLLMPFRTRSVCLRMLSRDAVKLFSDRSLAFIYIDANHSYTGSKEDLRLWWPKLKEGGIFSGHDYLDGQLPEGDFGVKKAVDEFVRLKDKKLFVTDDKWPTWYMIR